MVAWMSYIDVELFTNIANNYLRRKFDLGRPSVFLFPHRCEIHKYQLCMAACFITFFHELLYRGTHRI